MHALIVVSHPNRESLTHAVANHIASGLSASGRHHTFELADLAAEGFDPRFTAADLALHRRETPPAPDVAAEHARLDRADALVLVYPVYWWSFPGMLKGWIDRVFTNGWAYDEEPGGKLVKKLGHLAVHLVGIGGANMGTYDRHGYATAMKTQIDHGIFGYCGAPVVTSELLLPSDREAPSSHIHKARALGQNLFSRKE
ncbi:NAD(P)H dehydrogenase [Cupriavidus gilardii CR3]|uniref:NAD(P)H-dependent oxidoreductase n=1 Tax=Cupriavidus gilardii TaxID=82541 RepID=A0A6N1BBV6_9BURK|nr:NAD(P)H-dependent oxidoreductase [Cupriavidus gilardii]ALD92362.1 NAD(P)H dehydrogenase [Cupriavidus gilardii CR3]KAB0594302.1 NAD(P)H-dependent oxidoreductase [Cupriavidus gilardii]MCT9014694.1 NAD(P)H-dependent oxidoreductase [Cupriavidus gilardii]MCT9053106.1 NAD(P)H-dependent oxidoreductase [Cupriavidus gilardii]MCT9070097.1 NAD(P)H-dependent oxidoreductase [Cupriavidus gilardii]